MTIHLGADLLYWLLPSVALALFWYLFGTPRRAKEARIALIRENLDWQREREFHLRSLDVANPCVADREREAVTDRWVDEADELMLRHARRREDIYRSLGPVGRWWFGLSAWWQGSLFDREDQLDSDSRDMRWYFEEMAKALLADSSQMREEPRWPGSDPPAGRDAHDPD